MCFIKLQGERVDLADHEVYTYCPQCGKVHPVDLIEMAQSFPDFDLFSTAVYCKECSQRREANCR